MNAPKRYGGLDLFKIAAAFLVVAIHTSPLSSLSPEADFFFTRILARLTVPFFFMVTGQFILAGYIATGNRDSLPSVWNYLKKILLLYAGSTALYLPLGLYAGLGKNLTPASALRLLFFDGAFYHLWYFPALLLGILLLCLFRRFCSPRVLFCLCAALYLLGLLGDSYWGFTAQIPGLSTLYIWGFQMFTYTRNGLFFAPLFLLMGAWFGQGGKVAAPAKSAAAFTAAFLSMTAEGFLLRHYSMQRHDSMYLLLPVCLFFLYPLLLSIKSRPSRFLRSVSTWIYLLHPAVIAGVRGAARMVHATWLLVDNSLVHFLAVSLCSAMLSFALLCSFAKVRKYKPYPKDRAWIELDRKALEHNVSQLRTLLPGSCQLMPAVKANAYGHGAVPIAQALNQMGIHAFCVACVSEGIELRLHGIKGEILILGYTHPRQFPLLRLYRLTQTVVDFEYALLLDRYGKAIRVHLGIDTGMHRLGERSENIERLCRMFQMKNLRVEGLYSHLCTDDSDNAEDCAYVKTQADAFFEAIHELRRRGFDCKKVHLQSSYGILNYPELAGDYARAGIALYGAKSEKQDCNASHVDLRPVLSVKARVASVRRLYRGESAGYGLAYTADADAKLATLAIGYADGLARSLSCGVGSVLISGRRAPIVGRICMDQTLIDVTDIPGVQAGDTAVLLGRCGTQEITAYDIASQSGTITNEIFSRFGARLKRLWL